MGKVMVLAAALGMAGCNQAADEPAANVAEARAEPKRPAYCFFKDAETERWGASRDTAGNVVVTGRAFRSDPRYRAELGQPEVSGNSAMVSPTIVQNTGYASPDNWWDVSRTIANSAAVTKVTVTCGKKNLAEFGVPPKD